MIRLTSSQLLPIGLDLGVDCIKMLQLEVVDNALSVVAAARHVMPEEVHSQPELRVPVAMEAVRQMLRSNPFSGRQVVTCLPREIVYVKNLRLPMMPPAEVESAVKFEARNIFPFDTESAVLQYLPAGEVRQGSESKLEVIAVAAQNADVDAFVEQLHRCGCVIESLDFEPCSIYRGVERFIRRREDENEVHVLVDVGARRTQVIIGRGRGISFFKTIDIGALQLHDDISRKLGITLDEARALRRRLIDGGLTAATGKADSVWQAVHDAIRSRVEDLAREIALCLRYYSVTFRGHRPEKVCLLGGEAGDSQLVSILHAVLPIPVETGRPMFSVNTSRMKQADRRGHLSEWAGAFGMGLKMTRNCFGARDGKLRDPANPNDQPDTGGVEVVEISAALRASAPPAAAAPQAARQRQQVKEAAHA